MHGRVKVKTTEQQEKERRLERAAKLKVYRQAMDAIQSRRKEGIKDEKQLLMTSQVLQSNPDIHTLWNIRREVLLSMFNAEKTSTDDKSSGDSDEDQNSPTNNQIIKDVMLDKELFLTQQCLMANPKSYGAWHHRTWSLQQMDEPDWSKEIALCDRYLKLDCRNFHCWDYRQYVAKQAKVSPSSELEFTMEKIGENFSNYSAWHYRSKLLPLLHPDPTGQSSIEEEALLQELDLVQNAAFTDPDDSSAWFYHTWLLGGRKEPSGIIYCLVDDYRLTLGLTQHIERSDISVSLDGKVVVLEWSSVPSTNQRFSQWWTCPLEPASGGELVISISGSDDAPIRLSVRDGEARRLVRGDRWKSLGNRFNNLPTRNTEKVLKQSLETCNQLLELESDSKWTLYTKVLVLVALDSQTNSQEIDDTLEKLKEVDPKRGQYYSDLRSKLAIERAIELSDGEHLDLKSLNLSKLYHTQYLPAFANVTK